MAVPRPLQAPIAHQAYPLAAGIGLLALGAGGLGFPVLGAGLLAAAGAQLAFFRNPRRRPPEGEHLLVSPADGRVLEVGRAEDPEGFVGPGWRIAIFLSIFDVHVNAAPVSGKVVRIRRSGTRYRAAFRRRAAAGNVQSRLDLVSGSGARLAVVQITGLIARRIICYVREGNELVRGEPYGLICYGSRVELYLPESARPRVKSGDKVRHTTSVLAELPS